MNHYSCEKITDRIYMIVARYGPHSNVMQLLLGDTRAAIIDTGMGVTGNVRKVAETVTDLPIDCFLTHMHPDHAGASMLFDKRYMNPADEIHCWWALTKEKRKMDMEDVFSVEPDLEERIDNEIIDDSGFSYIPIENEQIFDLGGVTLQVLSARGHTPGSVVYYCKEENAVFGGDAVSPKISLFSEHDITFAAFKDSYEDILNIKKVCNAGTKFFCGHTPKVLPASLIDDAVQAFKEVAESIKSPVPFTGKIHGDPKGTKVFCNQAGQVTLIFSEASLQISSL